MNMAFFRRVALGRKHLCERVFLEGIDAEHPKQCVEIPLDVSGPRDRQVRSFWAVTDGILLAESEPTPCGSCDMAQRSQTRPHHPQPSFLS
jgi:hypothetical protein